MSRRGFCVRGLLAIAGLTVCFPSDRAVTSAESPTTRTSARITVVARTWSTFLTCLARWNRAPLISAPTITITQAQADEAIRELVHRGAVIKRFEVRGGDDGIAGATEGRASECGRSRGFEDD